MHSSRAAVGLLLSLCMLPGCSSDPGKGTGSLNQATNECGIDSGYEGDENCILPPDPAEGFQLHVGPSDYDDVNEVDSFLLDPGKETVDCYFLVAPNDHDLYNRQRQYRLRPHTHHLILKTGDPAIEGWATCPDFLTGGNWGGSQTIVNDTGYGDIAPEDANYASLIPKNKPTAAELHYYNTGDAPILREGWVNFYEADPNHAWTPLNGIALIGLNGLVVGPYETKDLRWSAANSVEGRRVVGVTGHVHSHTTRFTSWIVHQDDSREVLYELTDWSEPSGLRFNTVTDNPTVATDGVTEVGLSDQVFLAAGDRIEWECHVENDLSTTLVFANEALTAEMCILFGSTPHESWFAVPPKLP